MYGIFCRKQSEKESLFMNSCIFQHISYCLKISTEYWVSITATNKREKNCKFNFRPRHNSGIKS